MNPFSELFAAPANLLRRFCPEEPCHTLALRAIDPEAALPALGPRPYTLLGAGLSAPALLPGEPDTLFCCLAEDAGGAVAALPLPGAAGGELGAPAAILRADQPLAAPQPFLWGGGAWLLAVCAGELRVYRCKNFPGEWEPAQTLTSPEPITAIALTGQEPGALHLFCAGQNGGGQPAVLRGEPGSFAWAAEQPAAALRPGCAGAWFLLGGQLIRPARGSGFLQFYIERPGGEVPLCAAEPRRLRAAGAPLRAVQGYARGRQWEVLEVLQAPPAAQA